MSTHAADFVGASATPLRRLGAATPGGFGDSGSELTSSEALFEKASDRFNHSAAMTVAVNSPGGLDRPVKAGRNPSVFIF